MKIQKAVVQAESPLRWVVRVQFLFVDQKNGCSPRGVGVLNYTIFQHFVYVFLNNGAHAGHNWAGGVDLGWGIARIYPKTRRVNFSGTQIVDGE